MVPRAEFPDATGAPCAVASDVGTASTNSPKTEPSTLLNMAKLPPFVASDIVRQPATFYLPARPGVLERAVVGEAPRRAKKPERAHILEPEPEGGLARIHASPEDAADAAKGRLRQLRDRELAEVHAFGRCSARLHRPQHPFVRLFDEPCLDGRSGPLDALDSAKRCSPRL